MFGKIKKIEFLKKWRFNDFLDSVIGFGKFGIVYKAAIDNNTVAVKVPKKTCNKQYYKLLLMEVKIHSNVGLHDNVLQFIGASTKDIKNGEDLSYFLNY